MNSCSRSTSLITNKSRQRPMQVAQGMSLCLSAAGMSEGTGVLSASRVGTDKKMAE